MKTSAEFVIDLAKSRPRVERFAAACRRAGAEIWVYPPDLRPDACSRSNYGDGGDLMLQSRVEHKVRDIEFHDAEDYPFPTLIVDEVYKCDRIQARPFRYVIENKSGTRMAIIRSSTKPHWKVTKKWDAAQKRLCVFYEIDKRLVDFCDFGPEALS